jgi:hypothetical protein
LGKAFTSGCQVLRYGNREAGNVIQGIYTETIQGFTPQPLLVGGTFLASRASASAGGANVALDGANN